MFSYTKDKICSHETINFMGFCSNKSKKSCERSGSGKCPFIDIFMDTKGPPLTQKPLTRFPLPRFLAYVRASGGFSR